MEWIKRYPVRTEQNSQDLGLERFPLRGAKIKVHKILKDIE